jgi:hypothetical protein
MLKTQIAPFEKGQATLMGKILSKAAFCLDLPP